MAVESSGVKEAVEIVAGLDRRSGPAAVRALNTVARDARARIARQIREEVAFPARYLGPSTGRLVVAVKANRQNQRAVVRARRRATSLARFLKNPNARKGAGLRVEVRPGRLRLLRRAFTVPLRRGNTETLSNRGVAIRLRPGETIRNKNVNVQTGGAFRGLALLYGPSVQQAFLDSADTGVAVQEAERAVRQLEREYARQLNLRGLVA